MLTPAQINKFMDLHQKHFAEKISYDEALSESIKLVRFFQIMLENMQRRATAAEKNKTPS